MKADMEIGVVSEIAGRVKAGFRLTYLVLYQLDHLAVWNRICCRGFYGNTVFPSRAFPLAYRKQEDSRGVKKHEKKVQG